MENEARPTPLPEKELWDVDDLRAAGCGSRTTVWRLLRDDPTFPRPIRLRGLLRWAPAEIRSWISTAPRAGGRAA